MERFENPNDPWNGPQYLTGKACIALGAPCYKPAGTLWSPHWCQSCNAARMRRIGANLRGMLSELEARSVGPNVQDEARDTVPRGASPRSDG